MGRRRRAAVNIPNGLTLARVVMVPLVVVALLSESRGAWVAAAVIFFVAASTDGLDGYFARSHGTETTFGKVMDPVADKLLIAAALVALVSVDRVAAWVATVIIVREFAVSGLRIAAGQQGAIITASRLGKAKTASQSLAVLVLIAAPDPRAAWVLVLVYASVAITVASGVDYFLSYRRRVEEARPTSR